MRPLLHKPRACTSAMRIHNFSKLPPRGLVNVLIHLELDLTPPAAGFEDHRVLARTRFDASPALVCRLWRDALLQVRRHAWQRELAERFGLAPGARKPASVGSWAEWFARVARRLVVGRKARDRAAVADVRRELDEVAGRT